MKVVIILSLIFLIVGCSGSSEGQDTNPQLVGGPCEGCEAVLTYGDRSLSAVNTLPDFHREEGTRIKVKGTVYKNDGTTPASDVILYVYHTNQEGVYQPQETATGWAQKHGYIRGWLQTDAKGKYAFYTLKPAPYPNRSEPAHIHYTVLEPNGKYYWIGSCHFKGDSLLTQKEISPEAPRGGNNGLVNFQKKGGLLVGTRNITLGKNIPGYE